jgi:hypothetical protein
MRRIIMLGTVALVMAVMMVAMAMPAFAKSFASDANAGGLGPKSGLNFGHARSQSGGQASGQDTAALNPSYHGGKDKTRSVSGVLVAKGCC